MPAWLDLCVLVVLGADLAHLEGGAHLTVEFVLLLRHLNVVLLHLGHQEAQVRVRVPPVRVQVAATTQSLHIILSSVLSAAFGFLVYLL